MPWADCGMASQSKSGGDKRPAAKDPDLVAFGKRLRARREAAGLTQEDVAHAAGLHWTYVGQIERGERNLTYKNVLRLAHGFDVPPSQIVPAEPVVPFEAEPKLTEVQTKIVGLLLAGKTPTQIAKARKTSPASVQAALRRACKQAGVTGTDELIAWARRQRI